MVVYLKHLFCFSCAIILIQNGADVKSNVVIAPKRKPEPEKNKKPVWKWKPLVIPEVAPEKKTFSVFQTAIQKELQGVSHMVLDVQGKIDGSVIEVLITIRDKRFIAKCIDGKKECFNCHSL